MLYCRKHNLWKAFIDDLIHDDEKVASSKKTKQKTTQFRNRVQKPYPIHDQTRLKKPYPLEPQYEQGISRCLHTLNVFPVKSNTSVKRSSLNTALDVLDVYLNNLTIT